MSPGPAPVPSASEILDAYHAAAGGGAWTAKSELDTDYRYDGQGLSGAAHIMADLRTGRYVLRVAAGPQKSARGFDGRHAWLQDSSGIVTFQDGPNPRQIAANAAYRNANLWWRPDRGGAAISLQNRTDVAGRTFDILRIEPPGGETFDAWFDAQSHLLARIEEFYGEARFSTSYDDYRTFGGVSLPQRITIGSGNTQYDQHFTLMKAAFRTSSSPARFSPPTRTVADFTFDGRNHSSTIPFILNNNHTHALVMIDGKGPFSFLFDCGAQNLASPEVAAAVGLHVQGHSEMRGVGEGTTDWGLATLRHVRIGSLTLRNQLFGVIALHDLYPTNGIELQGMIGSETFRRFVTRIDYDARTFTFIDPKYFDPAQAGTPVKIAFNYNEVLVEGSFDGVSGTFQIDSGSRNTLTLNRPFAEANGLPHKYAGVDAVDGWGLGGPSHAHVARGGVLKIGDVALKNLVFGMSTDKAGAFAGADIAGLVGGGLLKRFVVTLDYGHAVMYLKPIPHPVSDLDTYDRAGLWANAGEHEYDIVATTEGGPAQAADLRVGDAIVAIDGAPVSGNDLGDLRVRLRNDPPGTVVAVTIRRGGETLQRSLVLRDQI